MEDKAQTEKEFEVDLQYFTAGYPPSKRNIVARLIAGKSQTEIASELGLPKQRVNEKVQEIRDDLRAYFFREE